MTHTHLQTAMVGVAVDSSLHIVAWMGAAQVVAVGVQYRASPHYLTDIRLSFEKEA